MTLRTVCPIIVACACAGCAVVSIHLYPVEPQKPILSGTLIGNPVSGTISLRSADGEKFSGPCKFGSAAGVNDDLKGAWDSVYGQGDYVAHVVGSAAHCTATLTGSLGTVFHVESYNESVGTPLKGIAQDSQGNIYKLGL